MDKLPVRIKGDHVSAFIRWCVHPGYAQAFVRTIRITLILQENCIDNLITSGEKDREENK